VIPDPASEPRWTALLSLATCAFLPATTARRTNHISLRRAYLVHLIAALLGVFVILFLDSWGDAPTGAGLTSIGGHFLRGIAWLVKELAEAPKTAVLSVVGIALLIEVGFAGVAYLIMPWGAHDEPLRASFRHSLRRTWLQTPHVVWIIAAVGIVAVLLSRADRAWRSAYSVPMPEMTSSPPIPSYPQGAAQNSQAMKDYEEAIQYFNLLWQTHWRAVAEWRAGMRQVQPWYLRFSDAIAVDFGFLSSLWLLGVLLRSAGAPRDVPAIARPPRCDACGYNLTTIALESRCPECGEPVAASLGPHARPGTPWQRRCEIGRFRAWRQSWGTAFRDPVRFGRTLRLSTPGIDHRRFLAMHLPLVFLIGALSPPALFVALEGRSPIPHEIELVIIGCPVAGTLCTVGATMFSLLSAGTVGMGFHFRDRRNLLAGAVQVVCYLLPYLLAWQLFGAVTGITAVSMGRSDWFERLTLSRRVGPEVLAFLIWFIPNLACGIWHWTLVKRAVAATRYANR